MAMPNASKPTPPANAEPDAGHMTPERVSLLSAFDLLTDSQLATLINVKEMTLLHWRREGKGPAFTKLGGTVFYRRSAVEAWIADQETSPGRRKAA